MSVFVWHMTRTKCLNPRAAIMVNDANAPEVDLRVDTGRRSGAGSCAEYGL